MVAVLTGAMGIIGAETTALDCTVATATGTTTGTTTGGFSTTTGVGGTGTLLDCIRDCAGEAFSVTTGVGGAEDLLDCMRGCAGGGVCACFGVDAELSLPDPEDVATLLGVLPLDSAFRLAIFSVIRRPYSASSISESSLSSA